MKICVHIFLFIMLITISLHAGITGKIVGRASDSETGAPLPGANVIVLGTHLGAATNLDGNYLILNVPPGNYDLKFAMIGYSEYIVRNVRVEIDLTTTITAELRPEVISGQEVVIVAQRPVVSKDVSHSEMNIQASEVVNIPVPTVKQVLSLQAGIEKGREGIIVRGGSADQTIFMVDGLTLNDERSFIPYTAMGIGSLQEIKVQTGGFNAEYGNVRSGLVNVVTKEGSWERYSGMAMMLYRPASAKHFGQSIYDPYSYYNRPYLDPEVCWTGTNNGAWDSHTQRQYPFFEGWNAVSRATLQDKNPNNDVSPDGARQIYEWQHRRQGDIKKPDYVIDFGLGGPVPFISQALGNLRFHLSHFREQELFVFPLSRDGYNDAYTQIKLTSDIKPSMKLTLIGLIGNTQSVSPYDWTTTPTGYVLRSHEQIVSYLSGNARASSILYMPGYYSPSSIDRYMVGIKLTQVLNPQTFYEVSAHYKQNNYDTYQMTERDTTKRFEPVEGYFVDESPYGYWGYGAVGIEGMSMGGWMNLGRDSTVTATTALRFDLTSQVNLTNQIKAGVELVYNHLDINSRTISPSMATWTRSMIYEISPYRVGAYAQDKLEFKGFIANVGSRVDYYNPNASTYDLGMFDKNLGAGYGNSIEGEVNTQKAKAEWYVSPRLGISHPITENSKFYFNYGHFLAEPESSHRFRLQRESNGLVTYLGNPNLKPERTVAYELGYSQSLLDLFLLNIAAYYKDVTNQTAWIQYIGLKDVNYYQTANNNYQDIRGFEITLAKRLGHWVTGFINYTYDVRTSGYFGLTKNYEDPNEQRDYLRLNPYQERPHPRPYFRANVDVHTPDVFGPKWMGIFPLGSWNLNILADWKAGRYETYNPNSLPGIVDDVRWRDWQNVDARLSKVVKVNRIELQFYLNVANIFNVKYMTAGLLEYRNYAGFSDQYDYNDYLTSLNFPWEDGVEHGNDKLGDYRPVGIKYDPLEPNPNNDPAIKKRNDERKKNKSYIDMPNIASLAFLNPRSLSFGLKINF